MLIRFASVLLVAVLAGCAANKPQIAEDSLNGSDGNPLAKPLPEGFAEEYRNGLSLMEDSRFEEAAAHWQGMTQGPDQFAGVWTNLGLSQFRLGLVKESLESYQRAVDTDAGFCPVYPLKGLAERDSGLFDAAQASYEAAIQCQPNDGRGYFNLGILYDLYRNNLPMALDHYRKARRLIPDEEILNMWITDLSRRLSVAEDDPQEIDAWMQEVDAEMERRRQQEEAARLAAEQAARAAAGLPAQEAVPAAPVVVEDGGINDGTQTTDAAAEGEGIALEPQEPVIVTEEIPVEAAEAVEVDDDPAGVNEALSLPSANEVQE